MLQSIVPVAMHVRAVRASGFMWVSQGAELFGTNMAPEVASTMPAGTKFTAHAGVCGSVEFTKKGSTEKITAPELVLTDIVIIRKPTGKKKA